MKKTLSTLWSCVQLAAGCSLSAAAFGMVILPLGFAAAGVTGISNTIAAVLPVPLSVIVLLINIFLLLLGFAFIGKRFVAKTIAVSLLFPVMLELTSRMPLMDLSEDLLLAALLGGLMLGTGAGFVLRSGASSGGFDILAMVMKRKLGVPLNLSLNLIDACIILIQAFRQPLNLTLYGILVITISALVVGKVVTLGSGECQVMIFSEQFDVIREGLLHDVDVGVTSLHAETGYHRNSMEVIVTVVPLQKVPHVKQTVSRMDPTAFMVINEIRSVIGRGYTLER